MAYTFPASPRKKLGVAISLASVAALIALPAPAIGASSGGVGPGGGSGDRPDATTPGAKAKLKNGYAIPPASAPPRVVRAIRAANRIEDKPYEYGGGHASWNDNGYDCSGSVSFALGKYGAKVIDAPMPSTGFMKWEKPGKGKWITTYSKPSHMYVVIAGLRFDTSQTPGDGPGWSKAKLDQPGYSVRHPAGF